MTINCPHCHQEINVPKNYGAADVACSACGVPISIDELRIQFRKQRVHHNKHSIIKKIHRALTAEVTHDTLSGTQEGSVRMRIVSIVHGLIELFLLPLPIIGAVVSADMLFSGRGFTIKQIVLAPIGLLSLILLAILLLVDGARFLIGGVSGKRVKSIFSK